ncbi:MAG: carbohydrate binding family 9 domain-containing protein [Gemmatimonadota bacterium]|nr:carbohydrate binding family 9 domain-containing protein [Gemmatimonadota bacterium]
MDRSLSAGLLFALAALPPALGAQSARTSGDFTAPPVAVAASLTGAIDIDGRLAEPAWQHATPITEFRQYQPNEGAPASLATEVRVLYGPDAIYIGARMSEPEGVVAPLARRDQLLDANGNNGSFNSLTTDKIVIELDPYHNHLDDAWFEVNPAGVKGDQFDGDPSWDPVWDAATHVDSAGWTAEIRIPYSQLRFSRDSTQVWGMQIWRYIDRQNEHDMWSFRRQNQSGGPAFFGTLEGLRITQRPRQLELLPYTLTGGTFQAATPGDPYQSGRAMRASAGTDIKALLTSNLTLNATVNPDFGQVEVDPASLNLTAFETYYDEKRPFFIAGANAFSFGGMRCFFCSHASGLSAFYSRRIGRPPQLAGYVDDTAAYADIPDNTAILGAAKITGRTQNGYTVGVLDALTNRETARYEPAAGGPQLSQAVEPLTNYFVGRLQKEFRDGASTFGGIVTSVERQIGDSVVGDRLRSHAEAAGLDWKHTWQRHEYSWMGSMLVSSVEGSPSAIAATEASSAHYFQRPDRTVTSDGIFSTRYDSAATALRGYGLFTRVAKDNGTLEWEAMANVRSPGFEVNDLAYLNQADYAWFNGNVVGVWTHPTRWYRNIFASVGGATQYNYDGNRTWSQLQAFYGEELPNYWNVRVIGIRDLTSLDDHLARGGPLLVRNGYDFGSVEVSTDARGRAVFDFTVEGSRGLDAPVHSLTFGPGLALKPAANVFVQLSPTYGTDEDPAQYVTAVPDPTATTFYGTRYVFAFIRTRTVSLDTRLNWTFTPNLTLQLYAQPFIASGAYSSFREFARPRSIRKLVFGRDTGTISYDAASAAYTVDPDGAGPAHPFSFANPDFTSSSLRGTAVLRWEYRPGSTLYFVWTQERSGTGPSGTFDLSSARSAILSPLPVNVFQIKATYWIGR